MARHPGSEPWNLGVNNHRGFFDPARPVVRESRDDAEMAFQNRRVAKTGRFVDFEVPSGVHDGAVQDWIQGLSDPAQMDTQEIYVSFRLFHR